MKQALFCLASFLVTFWAGKNLGFLPTALVATAIAILFLTFKKPDQP